MVQFGLNRLVTQTSCGSIRIKQACTSVLLDRASRGSVWIEPASIKVESFVVRLKLYRLVVRFDLAQTICDLVQVELN